MPRQLDPPADSGQPTAYRIRIAGRLGSRWENWFEGLAITLEGGDTLITGPVADQAALHGLLKKVRDLGMPLISVSPVEPGSPTMLGTGGVDVPKVQSNVSPGGLPAPEPTAKGVRE
jgi:hypothetical protein